jgi:C-terminal processing protease CtpA/Prc
VEKQKSSSIGGMLVTFSRPSHERETEDSVLAHFGPTNDGRNAPQMIRSCLLFFMLVLSCLRAGSQASEEKISKQDLSWLSNVLITTRDDIKRSYYDPHYHGLDVDARFQLALEKIRSASTRNYAIADIAGAVSALNDSHTAFVPPPRPYVHEYGWRMQAEGESDCFITAVNPNSDAAKKGVKPGDQLLLVNGYTAIRDDGWKINYVFGILRPQPGLRLTLRSPDGITRQLDTMADLRPRTTDPWKQLDEIEIRRKSHKARFFEYGQKAIVFRLPDFTFAPDEAHTMLDRIRDHDALVLDLRGNPGGYVESLLRFLGGMFDHDVKVADRLGRKPMHASVAKTRGSKTFTGKLIVLIDSESASCAELFARVIQLEKRGIIVGDRSSGKVMESQVHTHEVETIQGLFKFAVFITEADLIMADGKTLENTGVKPDELVIPSALDLAAQRDPALAHAAELAGIHLSPEDAGKLFPFEWPVEY